MALKISALHMFFGDLSTATPAVGIISKSKSLILAILGRFVDGHTGRRESNNYHVQN